jgi:hypothetical protein
MDDKSLLYPTEIQIDVVSMKTRVGEYSASEAVR